MESIESVHLRHRQRLRAKYRRDSATMCDHEILELFLFDAVPRHNTNPVAHALLDRFGSLLGVFAADKSELMKISGVGEGVAAYIKDAYVEYYDKIRSALCNGKPVRMEQVRNFMIWHRMNETAIRSDYRYFTIVVLDNDNSVSDIYDIYDVSDAIEKEKARGTHAVIVGVYDSVPGIAGLRDDGFVADVISVKGIKAESLLFDKNFKV